MPGGSKTTSLLRPYQWGPGRGLHCPVMAAFNLFNFKILAELGCLGVCLLFWRSLLQVRGPGKPVGQLATSVEMRNHKPGLPCILWPATGLCFFLIFNIEYGVLGKNTITCADFHATRRCRYLRVPRSPRDSTQPRDSRYTHHNAPKHLKNELKGIE